MAILLDIPGTRRLLRYVWRRNKPRALGYGALSLLLVLLPLALLAAAGVGAFYLGEDGAASHVIIAAFGVAAVGLIAEWIRRQELPRRPAKRAIRPYEPVKSSDL